MNDETRVQAALTINSVLEKGGRRVCCVWIFRTKALAGAKRQRKREDEKQRKPNVLID
jgi:hypothetical protein